MLLHTASLPRVGEADILVLLQSLLQLLLGQVVQVAGVAQGPRDGGAEVAAALLDHGHLGPPHSRAVFHDRVPKAKLAVRDHLEDAVHLRRVNEARLPGE
eukprot:6129028-Heterocapsa_arctica.AAC.1